MDNIDVVLRPKTLSNMYASKAHDNIIKKANDGSLGHSFLITGPTGVGKTTIGRALACFLFTGNVTDEYDLTTESYVEINGSDYTGVDDMRELLQNTTAIPLFEDKTVVIIDEAHYLSKNAQSALLKTLEEPPSHLYIVIITDQPEKLAKTVRNRCEPISMVAPGESGLINYARHYVIPNLVQLLTTPTPGSKPVSGPWKKYNESLDDKILHQIAIATDGSYRSMVKLVHNYLLTGNIAAEEEKLDVKLNTIYALLVNPQPGWRNIVADIIKTSNNYEELRATICNYISAIYLNKLISMNWNPNSNGKEPQDSNTGMSRPNSDMRYKYAINILKEPLAYANQKADFLDRITTIVLHNSGLLQ